MNFDFSEEQQMVRDSIARFVQDDYDWDTRKAIVASDQGMSRDNWQLFAELGWLSIPFAEEHGGFGGNMDNWPGRRRVVRRRCPTGSPAI